MDSVTQYATDVLDGTIVAGYAVRLACQRHLDDLERETEKEIEWRSDKIDVWLEFFPLLCRLDDGKPFVLAPAQRFIAGSILGWYNTDGSRRFRTAYVEMGKGNGKSPLAAALGLFGLIADREPAAEIYSAAVTADQAHIVFRDAKNMVDNNPELKNVVSGHRHNLAVLQTKSFFRPVSSEHKSLDGKPVHMGLIDELHEHPSGLVVEKIRAGTKARRRALVFEITNAGHSKNSVCWEHHQYSLQVLNNLVQNESWFGYVCGLDPCDTCRAAGHVQPNFECENCDDWRDEIVWQKANPLLDVSITRRYLREQVTEAIGLVSKENIVKRLNFCVWTEQSVRWLSLEKWALGNIGPVRLEDFAGRSCYCGVDLASTTDLAAVVLLFPPRSDHDERWTVLPYFFTPQDNVAARRERDRVDYQIWIDQKLMIATPGNVIDYDHIREFIRNLSLQVDIKEIPIDRWNSTQLQTQLQNDGHTVAQFGQGFASMSSPSKRLEELILSEEISHGNHAVLNWMAGNVAISEDPAGNIKPDKKKSEEKIDGIVGLIMALGRAIVQPEQKPSVYEERGLVTV